MFNLENWLTKQGYSVTGDKTRSHIKTWLAWYQGFVDSFHQYHYYNGIQYLEAKKRGLSMAKYVCEDWANLLLNERVQISVDEGWQEALLQLLTEQKWWLKANQLVEQAFALGTGAFVEYRGADDAPEIDYYRADMIYPLSWGNKGVTECAFASVCTIDRKPAVYVMLHLLDGNTYVIENHWFDQDTSKELEPPEGMLPIVATGSTVPLFQLITPNVINSINMDSPLGISVFGYSLDVLASLDEAYDSLDNEFKLGRKRIMLPMSMAKIQMMGEKDKDGKPIMRPAFDHADTVFYAYETSADMDNKPIELNMELRVTEHTDAIKAHLAMLGKKTGVGADRYTWDKSGGVKTATEVVSDKSDLYQNLRKHELVLEDAIVGMVKALAFLSSVELQEVKINFDDSIIQDSQSELDNAIAKKTNGLISAKTIMTDVFDMTEEDADAELALIREENKVQAPAVDFLHAGNDRNPFDEDDEPEEEGADA